MGKRESETIRRILDQTDFLVTMQRRAKYGPDPSIAESMRRKVDLDPETLESYLRYTGQLTLHAPKRLQ